LSIWAKVSFTPRNTYGEFVPGIVTPAVRAAVEGVCDNVLTLAQQRCPVLTGALRDSIKTVIKDNVKSITGYVAPNMPYAGYPEFGTGIRGAASPGAGSGPYSPTWPGMAAQPYMRPALDETRAGIVALMAGKIAASIGSPYK
jgi:HK97 gp10 family phage protein